MAERGATLLVVERELRESFRRRSMWITAGVLLLAGVALAVGPALISSESTGRTFGIVASAPQSDRLAVAVVNSGESFGWQVDTTTFADRGEARAAVSEGDIDAAIVVDGTAVVVIAEEADSNVVRAATGAAASESIDASLTRAGLTSDEIASAFATPDVAVEAIESDRTGRQAAAFIVSIVLYLLLIVLTSAVASGVAIEKSSRISEVLLAIAPPRALLFGKVIGVALIGLFTLLCGAAPIIVKSVVGGSLPDGVASTLAVGAAYFVLGMAIYFTAAAALGALVGRQEEVGAAVGPISAILILAYVVGASAPESAVAEVLSFVPFTSPMVMPARVALGVASPLAVTGSLMIGVVTVVLLVRIATTIYARAIVRTGSRVRLCQLFGRSVAT